jgi:hypothetical protein
MTRDEANKIVEDRIFSGEPFTFMDLQFLCEDVEGMKDGWRVADVAMQRNRRKGFTTFHRQGREVIWNLTPKGKTEAKNRAKQVNEPDAQPRP